MYRIAIGLVFVAACTQSLADDAQRFCAPFCHCSAGQLPDQQRACTSQCAAEFQSDPLGELCVACVVETAKHADRCPTLVDDCTPFCTEAQSLQSYGSTAMSRIEDGQ